MGVYWHVTVKGGEGGEAKHSKASTNMKRVSLLEHQLTLFINTAFLSGPKGPTRLSLISVSDFCHLVGCMTA